MCFIFQNRRTFFSIRLVCVRKPHAFIMLFLYRNLCMFLTVFIPRTHQGTLKHVSLRNILISQQFFRSL
jgi:hypothetical protein